jgi:hypothetical protein
MPARVLVLIWVLVQLALAPAPALGAPVVREDLHYQVSLGFWDDVAQVHLVLKEVGPNRYRTELYGAVQGMWRLLSRWLPERFQTEMVYRQGRFQPLTYREEFINKGQHIVKEYQFDYEQQRLTLWRRADAGPRVKKWQVPLKEPVYDMLSMSYNIRLGVFGPLPGGSNIRVPVLPNPAPQEMVFRIGPLTAKGRKVMLNYHMEDSGTSDHYFFYLNPSQVPSLLWTRVTFFGKLQGRLLNPGGIKTPGLAAGAGAAPRLEACR